MSSTAAFQPSGTHTGRSKISQVHGQKGKGPADQFTTTIEWKITNKQDAGYFNYKL